MPEMSQTEYLIRQIVDRLFEEKAAEHGQLCQWPIVGGGYVSGFDPTDVMKELAVRALLAREWFASAGNSPLDAPILPLSLSERDELRIGGLPQFVAWYARSLDSRSYNLEEHPSFDDYARGVMASEFAPDSTKNDVELQKRFPPRPLKGLGPGLYWLPPKAHAEAMASHRRAMASLSRCKRAA